MKRKDYMPYKDSEFDILQNNVYTMSVKNATQWLIPAQHIATLEAPRIRWNAAITAYNDPAKRTSAVTQEKNDAKKAYIAVLRPFIQGQLMHNDRVSDANRRNLDLPVYDRKPTRPLPPATRTEMEVKFSQIMRHTLQVRDSESKRAAKPAHVIGFELWRRIGGDTMPKYDEMQFVEMVIHSPHTLNYTSDERSRTIWYASRWVNTRGEKWPWSALVSAIVP